MENPQHASQEPSDTMKHRPPPDFGNITSGPTLEEKPGLTLSPIAGVPAHIYCTLLWTDSWAAVHTRATTEVLTP